MTAGLGRDECLARRAHPAVGVRAAHGFLKEYPRVTPTVRGWETIAE
jgi:hypothetical protein